MGLGGVGWDRVGRGGVGWGGVGCKIRQGRAGQGRAGQGRAGQGRAGQGRAGQGRAGQGRAGLTCTFVADHKLVITILLILYSFYELFVIVALSSPERQHRCQPLTPEASSE